MRGMRAHDLGVKKWKLKGRRWLMLGIMFAWAKNRKKRAFMKALKSPYAEKKEVLVTLTWHLKNPFSEWDGSLLVFVTLNLTHRRGIQIRWEEISLLFYPSSVNGRIFNLWQLCSIEIRWRFDLWIKVLLPQPYPRITFPRDQDRVQKLLRKTPLIALSS